MSERKVSIRGCSFYSRLKVEDPSGASINRDLLGLDDKGIHDEVLSFRKRLIITTSNSAELIGEYQKEISDKLKSLTRNEFIIAQGAQLMMIIGQMLATGEFVPNSVLAINIFCLLLHLAHVLLYRHKMQTALNEGFSQELSDTNLLDLFQSEAFNVYYAQREFLESEIALAELNKTPEELKALRASLKELDAKYEALKEQIQSARRANPNDHTPNLQQLQELANQATPSSLLDAEEYLMPSGRPVNDAQSEVTELVSMVTRKA